MKKIVPIAVLALVLAIGTFASFAQAGTSSLSGWGWSSNIGWVSFNSNDNGTGPNGVGKSSVAYSVKVSATTPNGSDGKFSDHAWSSNIGWISFNRAETGNPPSNDIVALPAVTDPIAKVDMSTGAVTGWARALAGCQNDLWDGSKCTGSGSGNANGVTNTIPAGEASITIKSAVLPSGRYSLSCTKNSSTNKIYCFGGVNNDGTYSNQIVEYNPLTDVIVTKTAVLPFGRGNFSCAENSSTHKIYCFGGTGLSSTFSNQIIEYNPSTDTIVTKTAVLPSGRYSLSCAENSLTNKIYCFGGYEGFGLAGSPGSGPLNQIIEYNPSTDSIITKTAVLPSTVYSLSCTENSLTHKIYCFGGYNALLSFFSNQIVEYNPSTDTIVTKTAVLPSGRGGSGCAENSSTHKIYCFGGGTSFLTSGLLNQITEYNPSVDAIVTKTAVLPSTVYSLSCTENSLTHKIYCFGGSSTLGSLGGGLNQITEYGSSNSSTNNGWDGWIHLSDNSSPSPKHPTVSLTGTNVSSQGVSYNKNTGSFSGYAWGSDVVGWLQFFNVSSVPVASCAIDTPIRSGNGPYNVSVPITLSNFMTLGYFNLLRNGSVVDTEKVNNFPLTDRSVPAGTYTYTVTAPIGTAPGGAIVPAPICSPAQTITLPSYIVTPPSTGTLNLSIGPNFAKAIGTTMTVTQGDPFVLKLDDNGTLPAGYSCNITSNPLGSASWTQSNVSPSSHTGILKASDVTVPISGDYVFTATCSNGVNPSQNSNSVTLQVVSGSLKQL